MTMKKVMINSLCILRVSKKIQMSCFLCINFFFLHLFLFFCFNFFVLGIFCPMAPKESIERKRQKEKEKRKREEQEAQDILKSSTLALVQALAQVHLTTMMCRIQRLFVSDGEVSVDSDYTSDPVEANKVRAKRAKRRRAKAPCLQPLVLTRRQQAIANATV